MALILADGVDVTATIMTRLVSLTLTDEEGVKADRLRLEVDDRDGAVALPERQTELRVSLGYAETGLSQMGSYLVDQISGSGPPQTMTIGATAADMAGSIRAPRTRAWEATTLGAVVETIAAEAGLQAAVGESINDVPYAYLAQQAESDMNLLTRLARDLDATAKAADGRLVVMRRGEGRAADGTVLSAVPLLRQQMTDWRWDIADRGSYASAIAEWSEIGAGVVRQVVVGEGDPVYRVRHVQDSEDAARRAAQGSLDAAQRGTGTLEIGCAAFQPGLFAGGLLQIVDLRPELAGEWAITSVRHRLGSTLVTSCSAERAP